MPREVRLKIDGRGSRWRRLSRCSDEPRLARRLDLDTAEGGPEGSIRHKEADVDERSRVLMATVLGAVAGGVWGWLYMTESGRRVRDQIEPKLDDFMNELTRMRGTVEKARSAANEGWRSLNEVAGGAAGGGGSRWSA